MDLNTIKELYQKVILVHNKTPHHFKKKETYTHAIPAYNPICGDKFTLYLQVEQHMIVEASFYGHGCAISKAASSILMTKIQGRTLSEVHKHCQEYLHLIQNEKAPINTDKDLQAFAAARNFPSRQQCATLSWEALFNFTDLT